MQPRERKQQQSRKRKGPRRGKMTKVKRLYLQRAAKLTKSNNVESQTKTHRLLSGCRSTFYVGPVKNIHDEVIKRLPHELTDLVCGYYLNLNNCGIELIKKLAHSDDRNNPVVIDAKARLGFAYLYGNDVQEDRAEAAKWLRLISIKNDMPVGKWALGLCFYYGLGISENPVIAFELFQKAAEQGYAPAQCELGFCYGNGQGVISDEQEAFKWHLKAAKQGDVRSQWNLATLYQYGHGVTKDMRAAIRFYRLAAQQGNESAQQALKRLGVSATKPVVELGKESDKESEKTKEPSSPSLSG